MLSSTLKPKLIGVVLTALTLIGCTGSATDSPDSAPRTGAPATPLADQTRADGIPVDAHDTLRAMQIRRLLLTEAELFIGAEGEVVEVVEAETVVHRWQEHLIPTPDDNVGPCTEALNEAFRTSQENHLLALMFVHAQAVGPGANPRDVAVGIASYHQPAQVQPEWEAAAEACDGATVEISEQEYEMQAFQHASAPGLSFIGTQSEHHLLGLDTGHNAITVYTETSQDDAQVLLDRQLAKLGVE